MIDFEQFLNDRINNNKNLENLASFFTKDELSQLSDKSISIVGTNGKTSTANYIYQILSSFHIKTLLFTSPHMISYEERIQSNQNEINHSHYVEEIKEFEEKNSINLGYFETLFLIACRTFIDEKLDMFIVEAGIGGRLDTTSIIDYKNVILTNVGYDHQDILGETLEDILYEKIKISNKIQNLVCGDISSEHKELISKELKDTSVWFIDQRYYDMPGWRPFPAIKTLASRMHTSVSTAKNIDLAVFSMNRILRGTNYAIAVRSTRAIMPKRIFSHVQGRFEEINNNTTKILDGAHNISGFETLFQNLDYLYKDIDFKCYLGLKEGKDFQKILDFLSEKENISINIIEDNSFYNQTSSKYLTSYLEERNINFDLSTIKKFHLSKEHCILIGSLYLIGEYKKEFK